MFFALYSTHFQATLTSDNFLEMPLSDFFNRGYKGGGRYYAFAHVLWLGKGVGVERVKRHLFRFVYDVFVPFVVCLIHCDKSQNNNVL